MSDNPGEMGGAQKQRSVGNNYHYKVKTPVTYTQVDGSGPWDDVHQQGQQSRR